MIQRAQSVYLFLVVILMSLLLIFPIATFTAANDIQYKFFSFGLKKIVEGGSKMIISAWPLFILILGIACISFYNIFLFQKRTTQMRLCVYNILLLIGLVILGYYYYHFFQKSFDFIGHVFKLAIVYPVVSIILNAMAFSGIRKDELIVKTYERLRK